MQTKTTNVELYISIKINHKNHQHPNAIKAGTQYRLPRIPKTQI